MRVRYTAQSRDDVARALVRYGLASENASEAFSGRLDQAVDRLRLNAQTFPLVQGRWRGREIRFLSLDKFPYALIYEIVNDEVAILGLWHTKSRGEDWLRREA